MSNQLIEGLFLLAFWAPPLAVLAGGLLLFTPDRWARWPIVRPHAVPLMH